MRIYLSLVFGLISWKLFCVDVYNKSSNISRLSLLLLFQIGIPCNFKPIAQSCFPYTIYNLISTPFLRPSVAIQGVLENKGRWAVIFRERWPAIFREQFDKNILGMWPIIFRVHGPPGRGSCILGYPGSLKTFQAESSECRTQGFPRMGLMESISKFTLGLDPY